MDQEKYLSERVDHQINWYDVKSQQNQRWFKYLRVAEIICAAIIPFLAGLSKQVPCSQIIIGFLGVVIAVCAALLALNKYQENWLVYRTTCESLQHEKFLFITGSTPYHVNDAFNRFVERVESLISKENSQWSRNTGEKKTDNTINPNA